MSLGGINRGHPESGRGNSATATSSAATNASIARRKIQVGGNFAHGATLLPLITLKIGKSYFPSLLIRPVADQSLAGILIKQ